MHAKVFQITRQRVEKLHTPKSEGVEIVSASWLPMLCMMCKRLPASTEGSASG